MIANLGQWVSMVRDVLVGASAAAAAYFAYLGINAWRRELKGRSEYQLAKDVLKAVYKVREAFKIVRNPATFSYEYPEEMVGPHGTLEHAHDFEGTAHVYQKRWEYMSTAFRELEDLHLIAQVEWGPQHQDVIRKLRECRVELQIAIQDMLQQKKKPRALSKHEMSREERSVLYDVGRDSKFGQFTRQIDDAIEDFEKWLRPKITH
jgi:hypothetical protein